MSVYIYIYNNFKENRQPKQSEMSSNDGSHSDASELLKQVETALDKVSGIEHQKTSSFTGRLIGTLTRTVKYVADVSSNAWSYYMTHITLY